MQFLFTFACLLSLVCMFTNALEAVVGTAGAINFDSLEKRADKATWYDGGMLDDAACFERKGLPSYSAKNSDMIGAMAMSGFEDCFKCMKITNLDNKKTVTVEIIDKCGSGCKKGHHIDLTIGAFKKIGSLNKGILKISFKPVKCPTSVSSISKIQKILKKYHYKS